MRRVRAPPVPTVNDGRPLTEYQAGRAEEIAAAWLEQDHARLILGAVDEETGETLGEAGARVSKARLQEILNGGNQ